MDGVVDEVKQLISDLIGNIDNYEVALPLLEELNIIIEGESDAFHPRFHKIFVNLFQNFDKVEEVDRLITVNRLLAIIIGREKKLRFKRLNRTGLESELVKLQKDDRSQLYDIFAEARLIIRDSTDFGHRHRERLLTHLNSVEVEVSREEGRVDRILGLFRRITGEIGEGAKDLEPAVELIEKAAKILERNINQSEALAPPDDQKQLPPPE